MGVEWIGIIVPRTSEGCGRNGLTSSYVYLRLAALVLADGIEGCKVDVAW